MTHLSDKDEAPLFLLGAGFNCDANKVAGPMPAIGHPIAYPLVPDLWDLFPLDESRAKGSIEERFQQAIDEYDPMPLRELYEQLFSADHYIASALRSTGKKPNNCYATFFRNFPASSFLTFNYDSLPELFLVSLRRWSPRDGYGTPVEADLHPFADDSHKRPSSSFVLHLHGSFCVDTSEERNEGPKQGLMTNIESRETPQYTFQPEGRFFEKFLSPAKASPYERNPAEERIIAPIREKASELVRPFVRDVYAKAQELLGQCGQVVAIGYDFNPSDAASYDPILKTLSQKPEASVVLVSPNALDIKTRLSPNYPGLKWLGGPYKFQQWVERRYCDSQHGHCGLLRRE